MQKSFFSLLILLLGSTSVFAQKSLAMKGLVLDKGHNEAIIGALVILQDSYDGRTSTDFDGSFKINTTKPLPWNITISYIGYHDQNITVKNPNNIPIIKMEENPNEVNKVIICPLPPQREIATKIIKGRVIDKVNQTPLIASTIKIEGTQLATITDLDGFFELEIPSYFATEIMTFDYSGYPTLKVHVKHFQKETIIEMDQRVQLYCKPILPPSLKINKKSKKSSRRLFKRKKVSIK